MNLLSFLYTCDHSLLSPFPPLLHPLPRCKTQLLSHLPCVCFVNDLIAVRDEGM